MNDTFCLAPWFSLFIGELFVRPCCLWSTFHHPENHRWKTLEDIKEIWNSDYMVKVREDFLKGISPVECDNCLKRITPRNVWLDERIGDTYDKERLVAHPPMKPLQVDFHLSNKCNLQCRMCASWASRNWLQDDKRLNEINPKFMRNLVDPYELDITKFRNQKDMFSDVIRFDFKGGEPMLHSSMVEMLGVLIEHGNAHNLRVSYVTNASIINKEAMKLWKHFKEVRLVISIDGTDELFSYIRGFDFKTLVETVKTYDQIDNVKGLYNVAISIYNILDIATIDNWMHDMPLNRFPSTQSGGQSFFDCNVINPSYLNVMILPKKYKQLALKQFEGHKHSNVDKFIKWLESIQDMPADEEQLKLFVSFTNEMDKVKGTNFLDIKPEFKELFEEYSQ